MPGNRVIPPTALIIGIDGGGLDAIEPLVAAGRLPNLATLLGASVHGPTTTTWPAHTAPGWSTFVTAEQPGGHGVFQFFDTQHPEYGDRITTSAQLGAATVWHWLADQGYTSGLINVPMSHPALDLPGYQVTWPLVPTLRYSRPPGLIGELAAAGVPFTSDLLTMYQGQADYADRAVGNVAARRRSIAHLLTTRPADIVMAVITEVDRVSHHYWHRADPTHPRHDPADPAGRDAITRVYAAVDELVGELLDLVGEETAVMLVSDHGSGPGYTHLNVNTALAEAGLLSLGTGHSGPASWFTDPETGRTVDFARTTAYMPTPGCNGVNLNLAGRQRLGPVRPADVRSLTREITQLFTEMIDPHSGRPALSAVLSREEAYPGPYCAGAPDLLLVPAVETVLADPRPARDVWSPSHQTGMHRYTGMWSLRHPALPPSRLAGPVALHDLAPTLLHVLGLRRPGDVLGRPVQAVLDGHHESQPLPASAPRPGEVQDEVYLRDHEETRSILATMGYL
jgi:predicted AlkP superfamily phosphohydrolase/phosphomutase